MPNAKPDTTPEPGVTGAMAGALLVHVPPGTALLSVVVAVIHTSELPVIADGADSTVTFAVV